MRNGKKKFRVAVNIVADNLRIEKVGKSRREEKGAD